MLVANSNYSSSPFARLHTADLVCSSKIASDGPSPASRSRMAYCPAWKPSDPQTDPACACQSRLRNPVPHQAVNDEQINGPLGMGPCESGRCTGQKTVRQPSTDLLGLSSIPQGARCGREMFKHSCNSHTALVHLNRSGTRRRFLAFGSFSPSRIYVRMGCQADWHDATNKGAPPCMNSWPRRG
jgi:hypothetical protein